MINIVRALLIGSAALICSCSSTEPPRHSLPEAGLSLVYSDRWTEISKEQLTKSYNAYSGPDKKRMPTGDSSSVIFAIANGDYDERTPIITISVIPNSAAACLIVKEQGFAQEVAAAEAQRFSGASFDFEKFSKLDLSQDFKGYLMKLTLQDRTVNQYHIFYCQNDKFIRIESSSSTAAADSAVESVLSALKRQ